MVYNFLGKDENTQRNLYLLLLKTLLRKRSRAFFCTVYPNKNHVTTHPDLDYHLMQVKSIAECPPPLEHSTILLTFTKLPFVIKIFVLSIFEWPF